MSDEGIKVGETYNVRVKVIGIAKNFVDVIYVDDEGISGLHIGKRRAGILRPISPEKNTDPSPKYAPCRLLRKGDKVQVKKRNGRCNGKDGEYLREAFCEVAEDEEPNELVRVYHNSSEYKLDPAYLELVTPVEELDPYYIYESKEEESFDIMKRVGKLNLTRNCIYYKSETNDHAELTREEAQAAAEAECKRLNAEYRKEQE